MEVIITRLRLGHCGLNTYRSVINKEASPVCTHCDENTTESMNYYLIKCPGYSHVRRNLRNVVYEKDISFAFSYTFGTQHIYDSIRRAISDFLTASGIFDML